MASFNSEHLKLCSAGSCIYFLSKHQKQHTSTPLLCIHFHSENKSWQVFRTTTIKQVLFCTNARCPSKIIHFMREPKLRPAVNNARSDVFIRPTMSNQRGVN